MRTMATNSVGTGDSQERRFRLSRHDLLGDKGQAFVELALVLPIFILMLVGIAEVGRLAYASIEVNNAARAGVAYAAQTNTSAADTANIQLATQQDAGDIVSADLSDADVLLFLREFNGHNDNPRQLCQRNPDQLSQPLSHRRLCGGQNQRTCGHDIRFSRNREFGHASRSGHHEGATVMEPKATLCRKIALAIGRIQRRAAREHGSAIFETAMSLVIFLSFLFGVMEAGLALYSYNFISEASREGARYAIVRGATWGSACASYTSSDCTASSAQIQSYVQNIGYPGINGSNLTVSPSWVAYTGGSTCPSSGPCNSAGNQVTVTVTYSFPLTVPFIPAHTYAMSSTSAMIIAQ